MPFDGQERISPPTLIMPIHAHPWADASHVVPSRTLEGSYFQSANHARFLGSMLFPANGRDPTQLQGSQWLESSTLERIASFRYDQLPDRITHLVAIVHFRLSVSTSGGQAPNPISSHRIRLTNGTQTDTGQTVLATHPGMYYQVSPLNTNPGQWYRMIPFAGSIDPVNPYSNTYQIGCVVALSNMLDGEALRAGPYTIAVDAFAANDTGTAVTYSPVMVTLWWECHG